MSEEKENKKTNNTVIALLVFVIMILCIGVGYLIGTNNNVKVDSKKDEPNISKKNVKESKTIVYNTTDKIVTESMDKILDFGFQCNNIERYAINKKYIVSDIPNQIAYSMVEFKEFKNKNISTITLDEYTKAVQKYLGKDYNFNPDEIDFSGYYCNQYNYDKETKTFSSVETTCGGICGPRTTYQIIKAVEKDGQLDITVSVVFSDGNKYYSDYEKQDVIVDHIYDTTPIPFEEGTKYIFKFKLEDGNYVFVSSEPANKKIYNEE